jgi:hypothetical protein
MKYSLRSLMIVMLAFGFGCGIVWNGVRATSRYFRAKEHEKWERIHRDSAEITPRYATEQVTQQCLAASKWHQEMACRYRYAAWRPWTSLDNLPPPPP